MVAKATSAHRSPDCAASRLMVQKVCDLLIDSYSWVIARSPRHVCFRNIVVQARASVQTSRDIRGLTEISGCTSRTIRGHPGTSEDIEGHRGTSRDVEGHRGTSRDIEGHRGTSRDIEGHRGTSEDIQGHLRTSRDIQGHPGTSEDIQGHPRTSRDI